MSLVAPLYMNNKSISSKGHPPWQWFDFLMLHFSKLKSGVWVCGRVRAWVCACMRAWMRGHWATGGSRTVGVLHATKPTQTWYFFFHSQFQQANFSQCVTGRNCLQVLTYAQTWNEILKINIFHLTYRAVYPSRLFRCEFCAMIWKEKTSSWINSTTGKRGEKKE